CARSAGRPRPRPTAARAVIRRSRRARRTWWRGRPTSPRARWNAATGTRGAGSAGA
ncbi:MAG: ATP/GTP-binding protein, partial [uncultured Actinomycetospora sp.]